VTLNFQQGDDTWKKMRARACADLYWFNSTVLGLADKFALLPETHTCFHLFLQRKTGIPAIDDAPYQLVMMPRDCGKTSCGTIGYALWRAVQNPDMAILIANEKQENANDFLASIKHHIETNQLLRSLFPEVIPPDFNKTTWSAQRATLVRKSSRPEATFDTIGVGGTVVGRHYELILCDDLVAKEAMENARAGNWSIMHRVNRWVNQLVPLLSNSAKPFPAIRFIGTRWFYSDTYDHIETAFGYNQPAQRFRMRARDGTGRTHARDVARIGDLAIFRMAAIEHGRAVFPEIWSDEEMAKFRMRDPELFAANLLNDPDNADVRTFRDEWLRYWQNVDERTLTYADDKGARKFLPIRNLHKVIAVDPAFSSSVGSARSAIVVLGTDMDSGKHFVLDAISRHSDPEDTLNAILDCAHNWGVTRVYVELAGQQLAFLEWLEQAARQKNQPLSVEPLKPSGRNKALRIEALVIPFKNGQIYVHQSQSALIDDEYRKWRPGHRLQDTLDALAYALEQAPKPIGGLTSAASAKDRAKQQLDAYYRRRGIAGVPR